MTTCYQAYISSPLSSPLSITSSTLSPHITKFIIIIITFPSLPPPPHQYFSITTLNHYNSIYCIIKLVTKFIPTHHQALHHSLHHHFQLIITSPSSPQLHLLHHQLTTQFITTHHQALHHCLAPQLHLSHITKLTTKFPASPLPTSPSPLMYTPPPPPLTSTHHPSSRSWWCCGCSPRPPAAPPSSTASSCTPG